MDQLNFYERLRVSREAPMEIIHAAYRTLMKTLRKHPDLGGDTEEASFINEAYEVLSDPKKRKDYDKGVGKEPPRPTSRKKPEERRRAERRDLDATISFCLAHDDRWYSARVKDVSTLGLKIVTHEPLAKGMEISVACPNPVAQTLRGYVRWSRMHHPSVFERVYEAGIEFDVPLSDIDRRFVF